MPVYAGHGIDRLVAGRMLRSCIPYMFTWQYQGVDRQYFSSLRRRHLHGPSVPQWEIQYTRKEKEEETGGLACLQDKSTLLGPLTSTRLPYS